MFGVKTLCGFVTPQHTLKRDLGGVTITNPTSNLGDKNQSLQADAGV